MCSARWERSRISGAEWKCRTRFRYRNLLKSIVSPRHPRVVVTSGQPNAMAATAIPEGGSRAEKTLVIRSSSLLFGSQ